MSTSWIAICQWCGQRGNRASTSNDRMPSMNPKVPGKCKSHPSGNQNMEHGPRWERC